MGHVKITEMTRESAGFYALLGPFLSRREIVKEVGGPIWDDDGKRWFVAMRGGSVVGFAALRKTTVASVYVLPGERRAGIYSALLRSILSGAPPESTLTVVATPESVSVLRGAGFKATGKRGRFTTMEART